MIIVCWGIFILNYIIRLVLSTNRREFFIKNLFDLAVLALPLLRPLRLLRMFSVIPLFTRIGAHTLRGKLLTYVGGVAVLAVLVGSLAITDAERGIPGAFVTNYVQGLWWSLDTLVTVGIDDTTIFSNPGHVVAFVLTIAGMAVNGAVTASIAAWLVERVQNGTDPDSPATVLQVEALAATVAKMAIAQGIVPIEGPEFIFTSDAPPPPLEK
jgi:voltage-gated potassium channel